MRLPESLRAVNPFIDRLAQGQPGPSGPELKLAIAMGLVTPAGSLTTAGYGYAGPHLENGPAALVMTPQRRSAAEPLLAGPLPLPGMLRRLLRAVRSDGERLVSPHRLALPECLLRPLLTYLEDLGLLIAVGPFVELTEQGRLVAMLPDPTYAWPPWTPHGPEPGASLAPSLGCARFRYHLTAQIARSLLVMQGQREWHRFQPLLGGPLTPLQPAYGEWLQRLHDAQPEIRRAWTERQVALFANAEITPPPWFEAWCRRLLGTGPDGVLAFVTHHPELLSKPITPDVGLDSRQAWLVAVALDWATKKGWLLDYEATVSRLAQDGIRLPPWPVMHRRLESAGLMTTRAPEARLLLPVELKPPAEALWPYGGPEWLAASLMEGAAFLSGERNRRLTGRKAEAVE